MSLFLNVDNTHLSWYLSISCCLFSKIGLGDDGDDASCRCIFTCRLKVCSFPLFFILAFILSPFCLKTRDFDICSK